MQLFSYTITSKIYLICCFCLLAVVTSCSLTKNVPDGEYLMKRVTIETDTKQVKVSTIKPYVKQQPNHKTFGIIPFPLYLYNMAGEDTTRWVNRFLHRAGNAPEIFDRSRMERSEREIVKMLANHGYLDAAVATETIIKKKRISVVYQVNTNDPNYIERFDYKLSHDSIGEIVRSDSASSLIKSGDLLDRNLLERERVRLTTRIRNRGYWGFNKDHINYTADTSSRTLATDLTMNILPNRTQLPDGTTQLTSHHTYKIGTVTFVTDYDPLNLVDKNLTTRDTLLLNDFYVVYGAERYIKSSALIGNCFIRPGNLYSDRMVDATYTAFSRLKILKYVNIRFEVSEMEEGVVNCSIFLTPDKNQSLQTEVEGTNSDGDFGFATSLIYQHRNLFKGSEALTTKLRGGYESITTDNGSGNYFEYAVEAGVKFPKFLFPLLNNDFKRRIRASTEVNASFSYQVRPEYKRKIAGGGLKYNWQTGRSRFKHSLDLMDVSYVYLPYKSEAFIDSIINNNPIIYSSYRDHLITRTGYSFYYSNHNPSVRNIDSYTLRATTEVAGNMMKLVSKAFNFEQVDGVYRLFGTQYEQYWKLDVDYAYTKMVSDKNSFAFHLAAGVGVPYGNSMILPFEKRYYSGGANSVRGWSVRTLGPGRYQSENRNLDFFNQCGDIRFDASAEYRTRLFWKLEMAAFVDAGNVWSIREYDTQSGGVFKFDSFYQEIALSWGMGMRLDFNFFIVRLDLGFKAYDPSKIGVKPWVITRPFVKENNAWHFAVGYPF